MKKAVFFTFPVLVALLGLTTSVQAKESLQWAGCGITKKAFMAELARAYEKKTGIHIELNGGGATRGIRDAAAGNIDIGGACRITIKSNELERKAHQIPLAWDALVVIVHKDNPVEDISFQDLKQIYLGKITNWKQLGGSDLPIELYARRGKLSGVGHTLRELVFNNFDQDFKATHVVRSSGPLEKGVEKNVMGVGVTGYGSALRRDVKLLKLNRKAPNYENIKNGEYVLYRPLYLVVKKGRLSKEVKSFMRFALSLEGQEIIRQQGSVPYSLAMGLVMKQLDQYQRASEAGAYHTGSDAK